MDIKTVAIIGAGTMGCSIAQWFAQKNCTAFLYDNNKDILDSSKEKIFNSWEKLLTKNKFTTKEISNFKKQLHTTWPPKNCQLVIEAIIEDFNAKEDLFLDIDNKFSSDTIFASNTSSLSINKLASKLPKNRAKNFLGMHFFNPATIMKLVELVKHSYTNPKTIKYLATWFNSKDKISVICNDSPGFIVNRIARHYYGESLRIIKKHNKEQCKEVDNILKQVGGFAMGPFSLMDLIGIDINYHATNMVWQGFDKNPRFTPHLIQKTLVKNNHLGVKTKKGFYDYE